MKRWQIAVGVLIVILALAGMGLARYLVPYKIEAEIRTAREQGVATTASECIKPVPAGQNAARDYERAERLSDGLTTGQLLDLRDSLVSPRGPSAAGMARLKAAFATNKAYLAAIHSAAAKPYWVVPATTDSEALNPLPRWACLRESVKTLRDEAMVQMWEGKPVKAANTLRLGLSIAGHAQDHPTLYGSIVGSAVDGFTGIGYRRLLLHAGSDPAVARIVRESVAAHIAPTDLRHALSGEVAATLANIHKPLSGGRKEPLDRRVADNGEAAANVHWKTKVIVACRVAPDRQRAAIQSVINEYRDASRHNSIIRQGGDTLPAILKVLDCLDDEVAKEGTLYAAACVLEYKAREGKYPGTLSQAVSPVPVDPFSKVPLDYKRTAKGFEVVSTEASRRWRAENRTAHGNERVFAYPE